MRKTRNAAAGAAAGAAFALLTACLNLIEDPSFDRWCGENLCNWELDAGRIERVPSWHAKDYAVSLVETGTQISQLSDQRAVSCLHFEMVADTEAGAALMLELDFNADDTVDYYRQIPGVRWKRLGFDISAPEHYRKLRFILRKAGEGRAVVAQLRAEDADGCAGPRVVLRGQESGAACSDSAMCSFGLCTEGICASCREAADCADGAYCVSGACSACRDDGDCDADQRCAWREADTRGAGRSCIPEAQQLERAPLALCDRDEDCGGGACGVEDGTAKKCGLPCDGDQTCPDGLACRPVLDTRGPSWVSLDLCVGPAAQGATCSSPVDCVSGLCCDGTCAASAESSCD